MAVLEFLATSARAEIVASHLAHWSSVTCRSRPLRFSAVRPVGAHLLHPSWLLDLKAHV